MALRTKAYYLAALRNKAMVEVYKALRAGATVPDLEKAINELRQQATEAARLGIA